jgi:ankyrin repeat protein
MPKGLNDTYAQILSRISGDDYDAAIMILSWLLFSRRPLSIEELAELVALDLKAESADDIERLWDPAEVLNICPNLLTTIEEHDDKNSEPRILVRLAHISIREYLLSSDILTGHAARFRIDEPNAHGLITDCCLIYMRLIKDTVTAAAESLPLALYVVENWLYHYERVPETIAKTHRLALDFFVHRKEVYSRWVTHISGSLSKTHIPIINSDLIGPGPILPSPLEVVCHNALLTPLKLMLENKEVDIKDEQVLKKALRAAYLPTVLPKNKAGTTRLLLQYGANFTGDAKFVTTLHAASYFDFGEIVEEELDQGSDINYVCGDYVTALQAAVVGRSDRHFFQMWKHSWPSGRFRPGYTLEQTDPSTVRLLLNRGADPKLCGGKDGSGLLAACYNGDLPCVKLLLAHGADPNFGMGIETRYMQSCLAAACRSGDIRIIHLLLDHGAYSNNRAALRAATETNDLDILRILLEKGIDPNLERVSDETPLQKASSNSNHKAAELLIQYGAKTDIGGGRFGFPLQSACASYGSVEVVKVLLSNGADVNQRGGAFGTALHTAAFYGDLEIAQYLMARGADIHAKGVMFDSVMRHAIQNGHTDIFIALFKAGADMDTPGGRYGETLREMLDSVPADKTEIWLRTYKNSSTQYPSESLCAIVRKGAAWQDIDDIVLEDRGGQRGVDFSKWDCLLPHS